MDELTLDGSCGEILLFEELEGAWIKASIMNRGEPVAVGVPDSGHKPLLQIPFCGLRLLEEILCVVKQEP